MNIKSIQKELHKTKNNFYQVLDNAPELLESNSNHRNYMKNW
jgi:hypothetical protein